MQRKIFSLEVFIFLQSDNFPLESFSLSPPTSELFMCCCWKWTLSHARRYLTWICSASGRNQWELQVSLKCCCSSVASPLAHRFAPALENCMPTTDESDEEKSFLFFISLFSSKCFSNLKLFKCYLHEILVQLFKKQAEKWASWNSFWLLVSLSRCILSSPKVFFGILKLFATGKNIHGMCRA